MEVPVHVTREALKVRPPRKTVWAAMPERPRRCRHDGFSRFLDRLEVGMITHSPHAERIEVEDLDDSENRLKAVISEI